MECFVLCRIATTPRIEGQPAHCCSICEKGSGSRNATRWKLEGIKGAGLDWAVCRTSTCWHAWRNAHERKSERHRPRSKRICPSQQYSKQIICNQHRLGLQTKKKQGAKTTGLKTGRKRTRAPRKIKPCGPPCQLTTGTESRTKGHLTLRKPIAAPRHCENCARKTGLSRHRTCSGQ